MEIESEEIVDHSLSDEDKESVIGKLFDCHVHPQDDQKNVKKIPKLKVKGICIMGTKNEDWAQIESIYRTNIKKVIPAFGIHPWFAHLHVSNISKFETFLQNKIKEIPPSIVGEIGLDKAAKTKETGKCEFEAQIQVFKMQLQLAAKLNKPVSVHCVRAFGDIFEIFNKIPDLPPLIMMHSFGGHADMAKSLYKSSKFGARIYFSFSSVINMRSPKTPEVIKSIPDDKILIESDMDSASLVDESVMEMCEIVAKAKGWSIEQTAKVLQQNTNLFFASSLK